MKAFLFSLGCMFAWMVLLPIVLIGGGLSLFVYAAGEELGRFMIGMKDKRIDPSTAHKLARRICFHPTRQAHFAGF